ncbi:copper acquisition factor BIM1-like domain-containing protein [Aspergillus foveolatus]|uniref:copper acquisition factor BIM1-like domain-containing protein n=1 Tax=Aspergillus foveolatus TaxID=210207 RepID=UPI003CCD29C3
MRSHIALFVGLSTVAMSQTHGEEAAKEMGPAAFLWPPDRTWSAAYDNNSPCGSASGVTNRTQFPLVNGQLALVIQDESWNVQIAISDKNNPTSNSDFQTIVSEARISDVDPGHMCYPVPNPGVDTEEGMNATFQIKYTSDFDTDKNETYYACADITYVPASKFTYQVPCFNVTVDEFTPTNGTESNSTSTDNDTTDSNGASAWGSDGSTSSSRGSSGLSGGAIAGIVVGCVAAAVIAAVLLFGYRRLLQKYRSLRQKTSVRNVDWEGAEAGKPAADGSSGSSYGLRKLK